MTGQRVEVEQGGNIHKGFVSKNIGTHCVVSWNFKKGRDEYKYNVLFSKEDIGKGRVRYEGSNIR